VEGKGADGPFSTTRSRPGGGTTTIPVATQFFGRFEHSLDAKGRVILPAKLRANFDQKGFLTRHLEHCLALWTPEEFAAEIALRQEEGERDAAGRNQLRAWAAAVHDADIDRQGRMAIPAHLRSYAGLEGDVLIVGMINRVELWSPAAWQANVEDTADDALVRATAPGAPPAGE